MTVCVKEKKMMFAGLIITVATAAIYALNMGEEIYRGTINDWSIVYHEGLFTTRDGGSELTKNRMVAQKGDLTYIFEDASNETSISQDFEKDHLEKIHQYLVMQKY